MEVRAGAEAEGMEDRGFLALSPRLVQYIQSRTAFRVQEVGRGVDRHYGLDSLMSILHKKTPSHPGHQVSLVGAFFTSFQMSFACVQLTKTDQHRNLQTPALCRPVLLTLLPQPTIFSPEKMHPRIFHPGIQKFTRCFQKVLQVVNLIKPLQHSGLFISTAPTN